MTDTVVPSSPPQFTGYHHLAITVRDIERSEAWYGTVLGLVRSFTEPHHHGPGYAVVMTRPDLSFQLALEHHPDANGVVFTPNRTGLDHVALALGSRAELDAWVVHLDALGVLRDRVVDQPDKSLATVTFRDPDGIPFELIWHGH